MQLERHGWDIHIVSAEPDRDPDPESPVTGMSQEFWSTRGLKRARPGHLPSPAIS
jgi:hypothetical protein